MMAFMDSSNEIIDRFVENREARVLAGCVSQRTIDRWTAAGQFPKPFAISGGLKRRRLSEILAWRAARMATLDAQSEESSDD